MNRSRLSSYLLGFFLAAFAAAAHAQATRTWVSGVGDDVNPCSRTAPCKTFAGAISKTAAGGEISVLDPGGYGTVTITKAITIDGGSGAGWASILNSGIQGIVVNAGASDAVILRNLSINGAGTGTNGIRILSASEVYIENCQIFGNAGADPVGRGVSDTRSAGRLFVSDTIVRNNSMSGIVLFPSAAGAAGVDASLRNVQLVGNGNAGLAALAGNVTVTGATIAGNANYAIAVEQTGGATQVFISDSALSDSGTGLYVGAGAPQIRLSNVVITNNNTGVAPGGTIFTSGNNKIGGNLAGNTPAMTPSAQQ